MDPITLTTEPSPFYILEHGSQCAGCQEVKAKYSSTEWFRWSREAGAYISTVSFATLGTHTVRIVPMRAAPWSPEEPATSTARRLMKGYPYDDGAPVANSRRAIG